jgi:hypothetical protein
MQKADSSTKMEPREQQVGDLPAELDSPARRALAKAGYLQLKQLAKASEAELKKLHGSGPNALDQLRRALLANGMSLADGKRKKI